MQRIVVDLPDPFGPRKPVTVPSATWKVKSSTTVLLPNRLVSPWTSITGQTLGDRRHLGVGTPM